MKTNRYPGWGGVCSFDPATEPVEVHEIIADALPDEVAAVLALTPHVDEAADWPTREAEAHAVNEAAAVGLSASWEIFAEKAIRYEDDGDVIWA